MGRKWVYKPGHPDANERGFVEIGLVQPDEPKVALFAPIMMDRFYENTKATDGTDIGSRRKHRAYMKEKGLAPADDFSDAWRQKEKRNEELRDQKERRETIARAFWEVQDKRR